MTPPDDAGTARAPSPSTWASPAELDQALAAKPTCWIFKHSTRCSISGEAAREVEALATRLPVYRILVVENRPTSLCIAERLGIEHASPQAILLREGRPVWSATHWAITREAMEAAEADSS